MVSGDLLQQVDPRHAPRNLYRMPVEVLYRISCRVSGTEIPRHNIVDRSCRIIKRSETGFVQGEIQKAAYDFQRAVEKKDQIVIGVNDFIADEARTIPTLRIDAEIERSQIARLNALRARRDSARAKSALAELQRRAATSENLLPAILAAVEAYATVGEISDALRRVFGEYQESVII